MNKTDHLVDLLIAINIRVPNVKDRCSWIGRTGIRTEYYVIECTRISGGIPYFSLTPTSKYPYKSSLLYNYKLRKYKNITKIETVRRLRQAFLLNEVGRYEFV